MADKQLPIMNQFCVSRGGGEEHSVDNYYRAGGNGTGGTAMAVPVFERGKMASLGF